MAKWTVSVWTE